jgi:hypothetical protein
MTTFRRKQIGRASLGFAIIAIIWTTIVLSHSPLPALFITTGTAAMGFVFSSLTVEIDNREVRWWFARIARSDIVSAIEVRPGLWRGWGIRWVRGGWLYNVSGYEAVEIRLRNGRRVLIGTDRPAEMVRALALA